MLRRASTAKNCRDTWVVTGRFQYEITDWLTDFANALDVAVDSTGTNVPPQGSPNGPNPGRADQRVGHNEELYRHTTAVAKSLDDSYSDTRSHDIWLEKDLKEKWHQDVLHTTIITRSRMEPLVLMTLCPGFRIYFRRQSDGSTVFPARTSTASTDAPGM